MQDANKYRYNWREGKVSFIDSRVDLLLVFFMEAFLCANKEGLSHVVVCFVFGDKELAALSLEYNECVVVGKPTF